MPTFTLLTTPLTDLSDQPEFEKVGLYARIEAQYLVHLFRIEDSRAAGEGTLPYNSETRTFGEWEESDEYVDPRDKAELERLGNWLTSNADQLPVWYIPRFREEVKEKTGQILHDIVIRMNHDIQQRREAGEFKKNPRGATYLAGHQHALEWARIELMRAYNKLVYRRTL